MKTLATLFLSLFCFYSFQVQAHEGTKHQREKQQTIVTIVQHDEDAMEQGNPEASDQPEKVTADFKDFPNLHPLFVHFPVVLLVLAAFFQIGGFFVFKRQISWVVLIMVFIGFMGAYIASNFAHPHVAHDLSEHARQVFEMHAKYARWTIWLSGIAVLLKAGSHFFLKGVVWAEGIVALVLLASAYTVSVAGHHGSQLVFIEGVGPQGKHLETGEHSHDHH